MPGALVISLDFELHWGARDKYAPDGPYRANLLAARKAVTRTLELFERYEVAATWATVGMLFAETLEEFENALPSVRPIYANAALDPYGEAVGDDEASDPIHLAGSLVERIQRTPRQEVATHTFSHFYCLEAGATAGAFEADLAAARTVAATRDVKLRSIVFPRNQHRPEYERVLLDSGITSFRGNPPTWTWGKSADESVRSPAKRAGRLADAYLPITGHGTFGWDEILQPNGLANVRASLPLRPWSRRLRALEPLRRRRIRRALAYAAKHDRLFHLWWHPHNFGGDVGRNLAILEAILQDAADLRNRHGLTSMTMADVADEAKRRPIPPRSG